jgi:hypothetical protein
MKAMSMPRPRLLRFCFLRCLVPALGALLFGGVPGLSDHLLLGVAHAATVERVVAVVADKAILLSDLHQRARPFQMQIYSSVPEGAARTVALSRLYKELV